MILTIDRVNDLLDDMADSFPAALFDGLNGGINLLEEAKPDPEFPEGEMYTTLSHELTHHMEGRGGLHALDDRDAEELEEYRREYGGEM